MSTARDMLDEMTHHALICALWTGWDYGDSVEDEGSPLDDDYGVDDVAPATVAELRAELLHFCSENMADVLAYLATTDSLARAEYGRASLLAHDYILTRNGHGTGFWDRGLGELGDRLTEAAHNAGEWELYIGDDGKLYA